ncbi:lipoprotein [Marinobacter nanhaiticus D15-8W]|uniref:Ion channel DMI1 n=1 Tax=Marinobacter nanhaiticus D15-8W TaxID=626887 RepID=N6WXM1_9GAMM|nr:ion channel DMI1 [Marinobacter nanhaiticus]ENO15812.1 ion channel DMI1 [Marinobacter nanhaiticus D15-8W]BES73330.1 lipoprotein [Marinobacter nanhaiticus D15-8W]
MLPLSLLDRVKYIVERQFVKGALFQLLVVGIGIGLISLIGGLLVWPGADSFQDLGDAVWWAFLRLTDPGYLGDDEGDWRRLVSTMLTVTGYVVFMGTLVAILTRSLIAKMTDLERGLTPVTLRNHVVVLGWTSRTVPILQELLASSGRVKRFLERHATKRLRLVVLSDEVTSAQTLSLRNERDIGRRARQIVLRSGTPLQPEALHRVACLDAAAVIVPSSSHGPDSLVTSDVGTVKALLSMTSQAQYLHAKLPYVVAEIEDIRKQAVVERAYPGPLEVIASDAMISRLLVQTLLHPGLSEVLNELLTARFGNDIFVRSGDIASGQTLGEFAQNCPDAVVLGLLERAGNGWNVMLNAPSDTRITDEDRIIVMARDYDDTHPMEPGETRGRARLELVERHAGKRLPVRQSGPRHRVLILGWNRRVPALLAEMARYPNHTYEVDLVSILPVEMRENEIARYLPAESEVSHRQLMADFAVEEELRRVDPAGYDAIFLLSSDRLSTGEEADARTMMGYLQLQEVLASVEDPPQVVMELSDPDNETLLVTNQNETLVSSMILSHILAQVALRRELRVVLDELFTPGGAEIMMRSPDEFELPAGADFAAFEKTAGARGETALGVFRAKQDEDGRWLEMNPGRDTRLNLQPGDQLVVMGTA